MGKETLIIFFGVWVAVQSFLGFPLPWDEAMLAILGIVIVILGVMLYREGLSRRAPERAETFVESAPQDEIAGAAADEPAADSGTDPEAIARAE